MHTPLCFFSWFFFNSVLFFIYLVLRNVCHVIHAMRWPVHTICEGRERWSACASAQPGLCPCRPLHRQYDAYTCHGQVAIPGLVTEYAGLSPTRLRILNGSSRVVGHMYTFDISTSTCIKIVISYMLPCYNAWCICFSRIPPASGLRVNFIIKVLFCSVLFWYSVVDINVISNTSSFII